MTRTSILVVLLIAGTAAAQPAPAPKPKHNPTPQELDAARSHFRNAEAAKARGDFQTAAVEYLAAYELFEEAEFFFDVAEVYRLAGDEPNSLTYYERYLELDPQGRGAPAARTAVDALRRSIAAKQDAAHKAAVDAQHADASHPPTDPPHDPSGAAQSKPASAPSKAAPDDTELERAIERPDPGRGLRIAGIATAGAGVVALGTGIAFGLRARGIANEASGWTTFDAGRYDQGKAAERDMIALTAIGSAAIVAGGILYYLGYRSSDHGGLALAPAIGRSSIAFTAEGRF